MTRRPPRRDGGRKTGRRRVLAGLATGIAGVGIGVNVLESSAYTFATADRSSNVQVAGDTDGALLELLVADTVKKNQQSLLVEITNNASQSLALDVALDDTTQGTLYGPNGSGGTVSLTLATGATGSVDLESSAGDGTTVPFSISHDGAEFSFTVDRSTTVESGNSAGEVSIDKLNQFKKDQGANEWTIKTLEVSSTNHDLDSVELTIAEQGSGSTVSTRTYSNINDTSFVRDGTGNDPGITLQPDDAGYDVSNQITYELTVLATDADGNFAQTTDTA